MRPVNSGTCRTHVPWMSERVDSEKWILHCWKFCANCWLLESRYSCQALTSVFFMPLQFWPDTYSDISYQAFGALPREKNVWRAVRPKTDGTKFKRKLSNVQTANPSLNLFWLTPTSKLCNTEYVPSCQFSWI